MVLFRHIPLAGTDRAVDVHLKGYRLGRPIQCLNQYARAKYEHCGYLWNQSHYLTIQQATRKRASPYLSQLDSLDYCHARKTESVWDNSDLEATDPSPQVLWCLGLQRPGSGQSLSMLDTWVPGCGPCQPSHLTHWGRVTPICVSKLAIIGSDNGLSPGWRQAIIWTNARILLIRPLGTNFNEMLIEILTFSFMKMRLKVTSAKRRPFCLGLNVLTLCFMTCISTIPTLPRSTVSLCPSGSTYEPMGATRHQGTQSHSRTQTQLRVLMRSCPSCRKLAPSQPFTHTRSLFRMSATTFGYAKYLSIYGGLAW